MRKTALVLVCLLCAILAQAQKNEISVTAGEYVSAGASLDWGTATAFEGSFAHRIAHVPLLAVSLELPPAAVPPRPAPVGGVAPRSPRTSGPAGAVGGRAAGIAPPTNTSTSNRPFKSPASSVFG